MVLLQDDALTARERLPVHVYQESDEASVAVAHLVARCIARAQLEGRRCVLGLATGSTPTSIYRELVRLYRSGQPVSPAVRPPPPPPPPPQQQQQQQQQGEEEELPPLSFRHVVAFNLDEYHPMQPEAPQSYNRFMREWLWDHVDADPSNVHVPDGTVSIDDVPGYCERYEAAIAAAGGIDLQLLGLGRTGHIGFNEPGSPEGSATRLIGLHKTTRVDAASDFFGERRVPRRAITMGIGTILKARRIVLMAFGEGKAAAVAATAEGPRSAATPASLLQGHPGAEVVLDFGAAAELTRFKCPWAVARVDWSPAQAVRAAVVWLSQHVGLPVLRLTEEHYLDAGLQDLLQTCGGGPGAAEALNRIVYSELLATVTSFPALGPPGQPWGPAAVGGAGVGGGGAGAEAGAGAGVGAATGDGGSGRGGRESVGQPGRRRVLIFSPHPDDDVIAMGGTMLALAHGSGGGIGGNISSIGGGRGSAVGSSWGHLATEQGGDAHAAVEDDEEGVEVHVAYQTPGDIAVRDRDALKAAALAEALEAAAAAVAAGGAADEAAGGLAAAAAAAPGAAGAAVGEVENEEGTRGCDAQQQQQQQQRQRQPLLGLTQRLQQLMDARGSGEADAPEVAAVKGAVRASEARSAAAMCGVPASQLHFLELPFYATGQVTKRPLGDEDVARCASLLRALRPHQIYAAGDLSDPHGTHRTCLQAVTRAIGQVQGDTWWRARPPAVWLYRGAWVEWAPHEAHMAVPLSPRQLERKVAAIRAHASQHPALFPGADGREFWERAQQRSRATAAQYGELGLPRHEGMELFVQYGPGDPGALTQPTFRSRR